MSDQLDTTRIFRDIAQFYGVPGANAGKRNGMYRHGRWATTNKPPKTKCRRCGSKENLIYHHKNRIETDNARSNIEVVCKSCHDKIHQRQHNTKGKRSPMASKKRVKNGRAYR